MVLSFLFWWPLGLVILAFLIGSGRMGAAGTAETGGRTRWRACRTRWTACAVGWSAAAALAGAPPSSGNRAFDDYRTETLRRLEEEQREFREFLERLRFAKDKAEFDQFMAERRNRPGTSPQSQQG